MGPLWVLQIFSKSKSFIANPVIGSRWLNRLGLHVARILLAHAMRRMRLIMIAHRVPKAQRKEFWRNGFVVVE
ncbi:MAG: hypothetical protein GY703_19950 [Gammaproteobacteria bacterium]|nr:hypothetical protein [Gammaproteobacteria bacterium]